MTGHDAALPTRSASVVRAAINFVAFAAGLFAVCYGVRTFLPFPEVQEIYPKWLYFQKQKDRYDVVFVGSSRFFHQVLPLQFDRRVKEESAIQVRSFNFGVDGMWPPESFYIMRQILAMKPARLRWVFIDGMEINTRINDAELSTQRAAYWHDGPHTWMAWQKISDMDLPFKAKWEQWAKHGEILGTQWTNQGIGAQWLEYEMGLAKRKKAERWEPPASWRDTEGYEAEPERVFGGEARIKFQKEVAAARVDFAPKPISPAYRKALEDISAEIRACGAQPILVLTPTINPKESFSNFPPDLPVWSYQGPDRFPALYDSANHFDTAHLNDAGAKIFTDLLAKRFADYLNRKE